MLLARGIDVEPRVVVLGFMFTLRVLNPPSAGVAQPQGYVIVPDQAAPAAPLPDVKP